MVRQAAPRGLGKHCHCCRQKRPTNQLIPCGASSGDGGAKHGPWCHRCILTKLHKDADFIEFAAVSAKQGIWKCPRCDDVCPCNKCIQRRSKESKQRKNRNSPSGVDADSQLLDKLGDHSHEHGETEHCSDDSPLTSLYHNTFADSETCSSPEASPKGDKSNTKYIEYQLPSNEAAARDTEVCVEEGEWHPDDHFAEPVHLLPEQSGRAKPLVHSKKLNFEGTSPKGPLARLGEVREEEKRVQAAIDGEAKDSEGSEPVRCNAFVVRGGGAKANLGRIFIQKIIHAAAEEEKDVDIVGTSEKPDLIMGSSAAVLHGLKIGSSDEVLTDLKTMSSTAGLSDVKTESNAAVLTDLKTGSSSEVLHDTKVESSAAVVPSQDGSDVTSLKEERLVIERSNSKIDYSRLDSTRLDSSRLDSTRLDSTRLDYTRLDSTRLDSTRLDSSRLDSTRFAPGSPVPVRWKAPRATLVGGLSKEGVDFNISIDCGPTTPSSFDTVKKPLDSPGIAEVFVSVSPASSQLPLRKRLTRKGVPSRGDAGTGLVGPEVDPKPIQGVVEAHQEARAGSQLTRMGPSYEVGQVGFACSPDVSFESLERARIQEDGEEEEVVSSLKVVTLDCSSADSKIKKEKHVHSNPAAESASQAAACHSPLRRSPPRIGKTGVLDVVEKKCPTKKRPRTKRPPLSSVRVVRAPKAPLFSDDLSFDASSPTPTTVSSGSDGSCVVASRLPNSSASARENFPVYSEAPQKGSSVAAGDICTPPVNTYSTSLQKGSSVAAGDGWAPPVNTFSTSQGKHSLEKAGNDGGGAAAAHGGWVPPVSPYGLIQEKLYDDPWKVLLVCILLNKTSGQQMYRVIWDLFDLIPNPQSAIEVQTEDIANIIHSLGLHNKRAAMIQRFSRAYLYGDWVDVSELPGIGKYAADAYAIFCQGRWREVQPEDHMLQKYWEWLHDTNGEGQGFLRV